MNSSALKLWISGAVKAMGHSGSRQAAEMIGITPSGLSKLLNKPERGFDEKTINCMSWILNSRAENWKHLEVISSTKVGGYLFEIRRDQSGEEILTWKPFDGKEK